MAAPSLYRLFVVHLEITSGPSMQIDEVDGIIANSAFSADIVGAHPTENDDKPVFVEDGRMVTSGSWHLELFGPRLSI
jgi:hypothetical protein